MSKSEIAESKAPVIITGASSGIGLAAASLLLQAGYHVIGLARDFGKCTLQHDRFRQVAMDLGDLEQAIQQFAQLLQSIEGDIRGLVNNAGVGKMGHLEQLSSKDIQDTFNLNILAQVLLTRALLPRLKSQSVLSDIIFIGSEAALRGAQQGSVYCASKFAIRGFAQSLREESASSPVRIALINPGAVRTSFFEQLAFEPGPDEANAIDPADVAAVLLEILQMRPGTVIDEVNLSPHKKVWQRKG